MIAVEVKLAYRQVWPEVSRPRAGTTFPEWTREIPAPTPPPPSAPLLGLPQPIRAVTGW